jgi:hypothetical protein
VVPFSFRLQVSQQTQEPPSKFSRLGRGYVPEQGQVAAIAAALQESGLRNLDHGDRDSLGLFQQRPSQGWGTPAQIMNPSYAATQFYRHLLAIPGWQQFSVNDDAQSVQRSGFPNAYGPHEQAAREIVAAMSGISCVPDPSATVAGERPGQLERSARHDTSRRLRSAGA